MFTKKQNKTKASAEFVHLIVSNYTCAYIPSSVIGVLTVAQGHCLLITLQTTDRFECLHLPYRKWPMPQADLHVHVHVHMHSFHSVCVCVSHIPPLQFPPGLDCDLVRESGCGGGGEGCLGIQGLWVYARGSVQGSKPEYQDQKNDL